MLSFVYDGLHQSRTQTFHGQAGVSSDRSFPQLRGRNDLRARIAMNVSRDRVQASARTGIFQGYCLSDTSKLLSLLLKK